MAKATAGSIGSYRAQSLTRGLLVLRSIAAAREPVTLQQLCDRTEIPKPTLVRLLAILSQEGCTVRLDDRPTYDLGPTVMEIAAGVSGDMDPEALARDRMAELATEIGHTAVLGVLDGGEVLHVGVALADRPIRFTTHSGARSLTWCTAVGKTLLAFAPAAITRAALTGRKLNRQTHQTITRRSDLDANLRLIRERGWAHDDEEAAEGMRGFAVPLEAFGEQIGALSICGPAAELPESRSGKYVPPLQEAASDLAADARLVRGLRALAGRDPSAPQVEPERTSGA